MKMLKLMLVAACCAVLPGKAAFAQAKSDVVLKVGAFAGPFGESWQKYAAEVFTRRTGIKTEFSFANPSDFLSQIIASRGRRPPYDVVSLDDDVTVEAIKAKTMMKLDPEIVTNLKNIYPDALNKDGYGPSVFYFSFGIAFNSEKLKAAGIPPITSWNDLMDPRLAGRVAIPDIATIQGRDFIIQMARLNGGDETTPEKGIDAIAKIKAHSYTVSSSILTAQMESGDVWVSPWNNMRAGAMTDRGLPIAYVIPKEGGLGNTDTVQVVANTPYPKEAQMLVDTILSPFAQLGMSRLLPTGPTNKLLANVVAADEDLIRLQAPISREAMSHLYIPDWEKFSPHLKRAVDLWNRMKAR